MWWQKKFKIELKNKFNCDVLLIKQNWQLIIWSRITSLSDTTVKILKIPVEF